MRKECKEKERRKNDEGISIEMGRGGKSKKENMDKRSKIRTV